MPDREKVVDNLTDLKEMLKLQKDIKGYGVYIDFINDAIALLKQEAVEPRRDANCVRMFRCGACGEYVGFIDSDPGDPNEQDNYCRNCGTPVLWKGR